MQFGYNNKKHFGILAGNGSHPKEMLTCFVIIEKYSIKSCYSKDD